MSILSKSSRGRIEKPIFALIYAQSKVGKTTFAASAPDPQFLDFENSSEHLDVRRLGSEDLPTYSIVTEVLNEILESEKVEFKSLALDSVDRLEILIHQKVCEDHECHAIEDIGWSKGYIHALPYWTEILSLLRQIQRKHKIHIIIVGHSHTKKFKDPYLNEDYDKHEIKLHHKAADIIKESVDMILFMRKDVAIKKEGKGQNARTKAFNVEERYIHTQLEPAFDAGSRIPLPEKFVVPETNGFDVLLKLTKQAIEVPAKQIYKQCTEAMKKVADDETRKSIKAHIDKNKNNAAMLRTTLDRILAKTKEQ